MPVRRNAHHAQLPATPRSRTKFVTRLGVSVLKVVATSDTPTSHHGAARPDVKNSAVLRPARFASTSAGTYDRPIDAATMTQSRPVRRMRSASHPPVAATTRPSASMMPRGRRVCHAPRVKSGKSIDLLRCAIDCSLSMITALHAAPS